jgi:23S rRNA (guanosine2251-2'-O)-methyltransferase
MAAALIPPGDGGAETVLGRRSVLEALRAERPIARIVVAGTADMRGPLEAIVRTARARGIRIETVDRRHLDRVAHGLMHQGVVAVLAAAPTVDLDGLLERIAARGERPFLVALDGVQDPHNLGAVIRTADAAGAHGVIIPKRRAAGLGPAATRAAAGATAHVPIAQVTNLSAAIDRMKQAGVWAIGADPDATERYDEVQLAPPIVLVLGGEHRGLHRLVREKCDRLVRIPLRGRTASLNVSVAAALLLYEAARRLPEANTARLRASYY